ncbi:MAG: NADH:flavin oxidoreductase [Candidatus Magnetominusculus sp. LBB02]|nr:NADH:flavin oxidoreductase [Candidatus Magnetominusculus sp. LBB02]
MLFEPYTLKGIRLPNRIVRSATYEKGADAHGFVTPGLIERYEALAKGGVGLIITGGAPVHTTGVFVPQMVAAYDDKYIDGLSGLAGGVHAAGGRLVLQIAHGGRQCYPELLNGALPIAPSAVHEPVLNITPREITEDEIWTMIRAFGDAARRAKAAGFDGVQIHGAHGYLVSQFLSSHTNRRTDGWGGDEDRRFRFLKEVYNAIRQQVGGDYLVLIKMNSSDHLCCGGLRPDESLRIAQRLEALGIDAMEVSGGMYESSLRPARTKILHPQDEAYFKNASALFKMSLNIPVIVVGGIRSRAVAEEMLQQGYADLISMSRPLIREPDLPNKFKAGKDKADCESCNACMNFRRLDTVKCVVLQKLKDQGRLH